MAVGRAGSDMGARKRVLVEGDEGGKPTEVEGAEIEPGGSSSASLFLARRRTGW